MSLLKSNSVQIGQSVTATNNFTLSVPASPDGTIKLARGNSGATTADVLTVDASGNVTTTLAGGSVKFSQLSTSATEADNVAKRTAKAWASIRGTGTVTILASFNVSSITDNNPGDYTVNFTIAMQDVYYAMIGTAADGNDDAVPLVFGFKNSSLASRTTTAQAFEVSAGGTRFASPLINLVVFR